MGLFNYIYLFINKQELIMAKYKITEEQYNIALKEGVALKADVAAANGDIKKAVETSKQEAMKSGVNLDNATIEIDAKDTNESRLVTIGELLREYKMKKRNQNSIVMPIQEFIKKYNIK